MNLSCIVLAAGRGTRMKSDLPKVMHRMSGAPLIDYSLALCREFKASQTVLVVSKEHGLLKDHLQSSKGVQLTVQDPPLGTGHAVQVGLKRLKSLKGDVLILYGDMPLIRSETLTRLFEAHQRQNAVLSFVTVDSREPSAFGRVVRDRRDEPVRIVEFKDATPEERSITELNVGIYLAKADFLSRALKLLKPQNQQKEYYLTDLIQIAHQESLPMATSLLTDLSESMGVNTLDELARAEAHAMREHRKRLMLEGVRMIQPESIALDSSVSIARGTTIYGPVSLLGQTRIGRDCLIEPGVFVRDSSVADGTHLKAHSYLDGATVEAKAKIGPFAHLRPDAKIGPEVRVGNFVEIKKSTIARGSKVNHLSYVGDATVGKNVNIGAGTITCNYDGKKKHQTILEDGVFVGSDTQFVAPVRVGKGALIGAGSTITKNVAPFSLALTRGEQKEIKGWTKRKR